MTLEQSRESLQGVNKIRGKKLNIQYSKNLGHPFVLRLCSYVNCNTTAKNIYSTYGNVPKE